MKTILRIAILLMAATAVFAQDAEPTTMNFQFPQLLNTNRQQNKFYYGWNIVGNPPALTQRYQMNALHWGYDYLWWDPADSTHDNLLLYAQDSIELMYIVSTLAFQFKGPLDATAQAWQPWLPPLTDNAFTTYKNDRSGASLAFMQRNNSIGRVDSTMQGGIPTYRWRLSKDTALAPQSAFSQPQLGNEYIYKPDLRASAHDTIKSKFDTRHCYLSINLRRAGVDTLNNDDTVLVIKLPYKKHYGSSWGYISFDSVPNPASLIVNTRGNSRALQWSSGDLTKFVITRRMLPPSNAATKDITLSAMFFADEVENTFHPGIVYTNPRFSERWGGRKAERIDSVGMEVVYYPKSTDVALRWLRLETPSARRLFWGLEDTRIQDTINSRMAKIQFFNDSLKRHQRIKRFYTVEEYTAALWLAQRYINLMVDTLAACEGDVHHESQMRHTTLLRDNWSGQTMLMESSIPAPYSKQPPTSYDAVDENYRRLNITPGHGYVPLIGEPDARLHPDYELQFRRHWHDPAHEYRYYRSDVYSLPLPPMSEEQFKDYFLDAEAQALSVQHYIEKNLHNSQVLAQNSYIFRSTPWWANMWVAPFYDYNFLDTNHATPATHFRSLKNERARAMTGEEARYAMWNALILGAKGFFIWSGAGGSTYNVKLQDDDDTAAAHGHGSLGIDFGIAPYHSRYEPMTNITTDPNQILDDPDIGTDWLDTTGGRSDRFSRSFRRYWRYSDSTLRAKLNMPHIYLGYRSIRHAVDQVFSSTRQFDSTLMKLQLMSWYAKGMRKHLLGDTTLFSRYVDTATLRHTLYRFTAAGGISTQRDSWDSSFYDITLHKHADYGSDSVIYMGVQNRRTNCLLLVGGDSLFMPMKDFQDSVASGRYGKYAQLGARRISIPFHYSHPDSQPRLLHIQELGSGANGLDTIVRQNANLVLSFLPGEGRMFRVTVQRARATIAEGNLWNSNQRKMVCYPIMRADSNRIVATDSLRYHVVYHRYDSLRNEMKVYYRRSIPYSEQQTQTPGIEWENEVDLAPLNIQKLDGSTDAYNCGYPSLVVRQDTVTLVNGLPQILVYVVYACADRDTLIKYRIVENVFEAQAAVPNYYPPREIDSAIGIRYPTGFALDDREFLRQSGAPTIGAASHGNYYAWADSALGIVTRWKPAQERVFRNLGSPRHTIRYLTGISVCRHPSLTTYVRLGLGERDVALTWEEMLSPEAPTHYIPYCRLMTTDTFSVRHFIGSRMDPLFPCLTNTDSTIAIMNDQILTDDAECPMVYRGVEEYAVSGLRPLSIAHWDRVVWTWNASYPNYQRVCYRGMDIADSNATTTPRWAATGIWKIWSSVATVGVANIAQGGVNIASDGFTNISDSAVVLNFSIRHTILDTLFLPHVMQLWCGYWSVIPANPEIDPYTAPAPWLQPYLQYVDKGVLAHLSAQSSIVHGSEWHKNRRVYMSTFADDYNGTIVSSAEHFYKVQAEEQNRPLHYAGFVLPRDSGRVFKTLLSQANAGGKELLFRTEKKVVDGMMRIKTDTIYSDWFRAGNTTKLRAFTLGVNNPCVRVQVERRKENGNDRGERFELPYFAAGNDTAKRRNSFTLLRGGNKLYRLALINTCGNNINSPRYTEEIQLDGLTAADREADLAKSGIEEDVAIDLGDVVQGNDVVALQPNPANEKVTLRFDGLPDDYEDTHYNYELGIYTQLGQRVYRGSIRAGESQTLSTASFVPGVYRVQVCGSRSAVSMPMVIMR